MPAHLPAGTTPDIGIRSSQSRCREESNRAISLCVMSFLGGNMYTGLCASLISNVIPSCNKETIDMKPTHYPWYLLALSLFHTDLASKIFIDLYMKPILRQRRMDIMKKT